jgi:hypothetical protein
MKKLIVGLVAVAAVLALRPVGKRMAQKMREHCEQMAGKCQQKMAQFGGGGKEAGMREHCEQMAAQHKEKMERFGIGDQETPAPEHSEATAPEVGGGREVLSTA